MNYLEMKHFVRSVAKHDLVDMQQLTIELYDDKESPK